MGTLVVDKSCRALKLTIIITDKCHMKFTSFLFIGISLLAYAKAEVSFKGVLVQISDPKIIKQGEFQNLKKRYHLVEKKYFSSSQIILLVPEKKSVIKVSDFCSEVIKISGVKLCEPDRKLNSEEICLESKILPDSFINLPNIVVDNNCELVSRIQAPHDIEGLSTYWAQEYTGADLVREKFEKSTPPYPVPNNLFAVWDDDLQKHGQYVSNLISGPNRSALIPEKQSRPFILVQSTSDYISAFEARVQECRNEKSCPNYINHSMNWKKSQLIANSVKKISENAVFVTSSGNGWKFTEDVKIKAASEGNIILVASLAPTGLASEFTSISSEVTISAPSDMAITSFDNAARSARFGGTSAAAPQVTAALAAFTLISGLPLTTSEAKKILQKTALKHPFYPTKNSLGGGMLNSYKIAEVAFKITKECSSESNKIDCARAKLQDENTYSFPPKSPDLLKKSAELFPQCHGQKDLIKNKPSCEEQKLLFNELRKEALLNPMASKLWETISCISKLDGLSKNAQFYEAMGKREQISDESLLNELFKLDESYHVYKYVLTHPDWKNRPELVERLIQNDVSGNKIAEFILTQPHWRDHPEFIKDLMLKGRYMDHYILQFALSKSHWQDHPEFVEEIIRRDLVKDDDIDLYIFSNDEWKNIFKKRLGLEQVDAKSVRAKLSN